MIDCITSLKRENGLYVFYKGFPYLYYESIFPEEHFLVLNYIQNI